MASRRTTENRIHTQNRAKRKYFVMKLNAKVGFKIIYGKSGKRKIVDETEIERERREESGE